MLQKLKDLKINILRIYRTFHATFNSRVRGRKGGRSLLTDCRKRGKMKNYTHFGALRLFNKKIDYTNSIFISRLKRELYRTQNSQQQHHHEHDHVPASCISFGYCRRRNHLISFLSHCQTSLIFLFDEKIYRYTCLKSLLYN